MAKIHLKISVDPLHGGEDVEALCEEMVINAEAIPLGEEEIPTLIKGCSKCFKRLRHSFIYGYLYVISSGQGALDAQRGRDAEEI